MPVIEQVINEDRLTFTFRLAPWPPSTMIGHITAGSSTLPLVAPKLLICCMPRTGWAGWSRSRTIVYTFVLSLRILLTRWRTRYAIRWLAWFLLSTTLQTQMKDDLLEKCCVASGCGWCCILNSHERPVGCDQGPSIPQPCRFGCGAVKSHRSTRLCGRPACSQGRDELDSNRMTQE